MTRAKVKVLLAGLTILAGFVAAQQRRQSEIDLQAAIRQESVNGDLKAAIKQYASVAAKYAKRDRATAAMALVHEAQTYQKLGDAQSKKIFAQILKDYADQKDAVALARAQMGGSGASALGPIHKLVCSDCEGLLSPDGRSLLLRDAAPGIRTLDLATRKVKTVVEPVAGSAEINPIFSADGSRIAYSSRPTAPPNGPETENVEVVNADGSGRRTVYRGAWVLAWSPDEKRLLAERIKPGNLNTLFWIDVATGAAQDLPIEHRNIDSAMVSPDGRYVAFNGSKDREEENLYLMASDGSGEALVAPNAAYQEPVGWTPDGRYLLYGQYFGSSTELWAVALVNGRPQGEAIDLHEELEKSAFESVGRSGALAYSTHISDAHVYTATLDPMSGKLASKPVLAPLAASNSQPRWSADSQQLAYQRIIDARNRIGSSWELSVYSFASGEDKRAATQNKVAIPAYCWGSDGGSLLLNILDDQNHQVPSRYDLTSGAISPLFQGMPPFSLRSCGGSVVVGFTSAGANPYVGLNFPGGNPRANVNLEVRDLSNGSTRTIYKPESAIYPSVAHDGRKVAFAVSTGGHTVLRVVPTDGGAPIDVLTLGSGASINLGWSVAWSANDQYLYFLQQIGQDPMELFRVPAGGGNPEPAGLSGEDLSSLSISPDGKHIAFAKGLGSRPQIWTTENYLPLASK